MFFHFVFRSLIRTLATPNLGCISEIKMKKFFHFVFRSIIRTLATPNLGCISEIKMKKCFFILYFARFALTLPQKIEKGHLCALTSSRFFLN